MNTRQQEIAEKLKKYPSYCDSRISKLMRRRNPSVRAVDVAAVRALVGVGGANVKQVPVMKPLAVVPRVRIKSLNDFRKLHDNAEKIRVKLATVRDGMYVTEEELRQLCEIPVQYWRRNADLPEFDGNKFKHEGTTYWAQPETIRQMKQITGRA
jgi:hypothetical protein